MSEPKLKPISDDQRVGFGGGYRGNQLLQWRTGAITKDERIIEEFAVQCKCGRWWGWTHLGRAQKVLEKIQLKGCPKCRGTEGD